MAFDFNPFNSSLFTGAGTPWGAKQQQGPDYSKFDMNPNNYQGFDSSKLRQALNQRVAQRGGAAQAQAMAALSKQGIKGADTSRALTDLAGQQEAATNEMDANLALQDYQTKMQQMALAQNQFNRGQDWAAMQSQGEDAGRSALWQNLFNTAGTVGGAVLGGYMGGKSPKAAGGVAPAASSGMDWFSTQKPPSSNPYNLSLWK